MKVWMLAIALSMSAVGVCAAVDDGPVAVPAPRPGAAAPAVPPEARYNAGHELAKRRDWKGAEAAYRDAIHGRAAFPEAWNGLGYVLRHQGRYDESVRAYHEALRLKPDYPSALEYLGEAYVKMGRMADARRLLEQLRKLKATEEADDLAKAINAADKGAAAPASRW
jgi:tetratricopeptide (TPR) repeat protein